MVMSDTGEKFELRKHNVKFDDSSDLVEVDGGTKILVNSIKNFVQLDS